MSRVRGKETPITAPKIFCLCGNRLVVPEQLKEQFTAGGELLLRCDKCGKLSMVKNQEVESQTEPLKLHRWAESFI